VSEATQFPDAKLRNADRQGGNQTDKIENMTEAEPVTPSNPPKISHFFRRLFQQHRPSADIRIKSPNFSEPDIRTTHLIWSVVYRKATERRGPSIVAPAFQLRFALPCGFLLRRFAPSRAYCRYECQGAAGTNAVHRDVVRTGIRHIGELAGRMDGDGGRSRSCGYCSNGR
jgi:hypothetical protein